MHRRVAQLADPILLELVSRLRGVAQHDTLAPSGLLHVEEHMAAFQRRVGDYLIIVLRLHKGRFHRDVGIGHLEHIPFRNRCGGGGILVADHRQLTQLIARLRKDDDADVLPRQGKGIGDPDAAMRRGIHTDAQSGPEVGGHRHIEVGHLEHRIVDGDGVLGSTGPIDDIAIDPVTRLRLGAQRHLLSFDGLGAIGRNLAVFGVLVDGDFVRQLEFRRHHHVEFGHLETAAADRDRHLGIIGLGNDILRQGVVPVGLGRQLDHLSVEGFLFAGLH